MPTYEYECKSCGHISDFFHSMTAKPRVRCPACGGKTRKLIGMGAGIIFKGGGFYETDYKRQSGLSEGNTRTLGSENEHYEPNSKKVSEAKGGRKR